MAINNHEFVREPFGGLDRESAYDTERGLARRRLRRQLLGLGLVIVAKVAVGYLAYLVAGWWGVAAVAIAVVALLFVRGTHAGITPWR